MITIRKSTEFGVQKIETLSDGAWVQLTDPSSLEMEQFNQELEIPKDFITYSLDLDERARIEKENGNLLIVLRVPQFQGESADIPYTTVPLGIVLSHKLIITVCKLDHEILQRLSKGIARGFDTHKPIRFLLHIFHAAADEYLLYLREINKSVDLLEDQLEQSLRNKEVLKLLKYQKSLTYFTTALKSNSRMMTHLQNSRLFDQHPEDQDLLDDVLTEIGQAIEMTEIASGILSQMMDAFASIISNNLNVVMKFLASITIILALPTLIASIYGMNIDLPLDSYPHAFGVTLGLSIAISGIVAIVFKKLGWL